MAINKELLGPQLDEEKEAFAIESLVFSVQVALQKAMSKHGVANKELAQRLGMSPARVSQVFSSNGPNLTLKTIARIQHALGEDFEFISKSEIEAPKPQEAFKLFKGVNFGKPKLAWNEVHNSQTKPRARAKAA
jgi:transcriptional regulator with XRE-family HTH domain